MNTKNKVQLIGTVGLPTVIGLETDVLKATFKIETTSIYLNDAGIKTNGVFKHLCIAYGKLAEIIDRHLTEGMEIAIEGILVQDAHTGQTHVQVNDLLENPEALTIKIRLSLTTKWIDNQKVSWSIKTGNTWSKGPDYPLVSGKNSY